MDTVTTVFRFPAGSRFADNTEPRVLPKEARLTGGRV